MIVVTLVKTVRLKLKKSVQAKIIGFTLGNGLPLKVNGMKLMKNISQMSVRVILKNL